GEAAHSFVSRDRAGPGVPSGVFAALASLLPCGSWVSQPVAFPSLLQPEVPWRPGRLPVLSIPKACFDPEPRGRISDTCRQGLTSGLPARTMVGRREPHDPRPISRSNHRQLTWRARL